MNDLIINNKLLASFFLIIIAVLLRWLFIRYLRTIPSDEDELPKRWMNTARNVISILVVIGLILIWLSELRFVALSIATFTVALIIATREFIQCFLGALYQTSTRAFSIGDWIKVGSHHGEVASSDWLTTKLLEIDIESAGYGYTGKTIVIPNHQFVSGPVYNFNFMRRYIAHTFSLVRDADQINLVEVKRLLLKKAHQYCEPFKDVAQRYSQLIEKRLGITLPDSGVSIRLTTTNLGKNQLTISVFCPTQESAAIEQRLTEDFMVFWYDELNRLKQEKNKKEESCQFH